MKTCHKCGVSMDISAFNKCSTTNDGRQAWCKVCQKENKRAWSSLMKAREGILYPSFKTCGRCDKNLPREYFTKNMAVVDGLDYFCKSCIAQKHIDLKRRFVKGYGGKCSCCGESRIEFLSMEHKDKSGMKHRAERQVQGAWRDAINAGFPDTYTVLCYNCNQAETHGRICPHKTELIVGMMVSLKLLSHQTGSEKGLELR